MDPREQAEAASRELAQQLGVLWKAEVWEQRRSTIGPIIGWEYGASLGDLTVRSISFPSAGSFEADLKIPGRDNFNRWIGSGQTPTSAIMAVFAVALGDVDSQRAAVIGARDATIANERATREAHRAAKL